MSQRQVVDHTEVVAMIRKQNWKNGGALCVDTSEAEEAVYALVQSAAKIVHARCLEAAEKAAESFSADRVVDAVRYTCTVV